MAEKTLGPLIEINRAIRENRIADYRSPNLALGMRPIAFEGGRSQWEWLQQPSSTCNPFGLIQGGYLALFIDELLGTAIGSVLEEGEWAVTAEMKLSYLRPVRPGAMKGAARVVRRTKSVAFLEARVEQTPEEASVLASSTWSISGSSR